MNAALSKYRGRKETSRRPRVGEYVEVVDRRPGLEATRYTNRLLINLNQFPRNAFAAGPGVSSAAVEGIRNSISRWSLRDRKMTTIRNFERRSGRRILVGAPLGAHNDPDGPTRRRNTSPKRVRIYPATRSARPTLTTAPQKSARCCSATSAGGRQDVGNKTCRGYRIFPPASRTTSSRTRDAVHAISTGASPHCTSILAIRFASAFHGGFADILSRCCFQHFTIAEAVKNQISKLRGDLSQRSLLGTWLPVSARRIGNYRPLREGRFLIDKVDTGHWIARRPRGDPLLSPNLHARVVCNSRAGPCLVLDDCRFFVTIYRSRTSWRTWILA